jgi:hypothetical protein
MYYENIMNQNVIAKLLADSRRYFGSTTPGAPSIKPGKRSSPGAFEDLLRIPALAEFAGPSTTTHGEMVWTPPTP